MCVYAVSVRSLNCRRDSMNFANADRLVRNLDMV